MKIVYRFLQLILEDGKEQRLFLETWWSLGNFQCAKKYIFVILKIRDFFQVFFTHHRDMLVYFRVRNQFRTLKHQSGK